MAVDKKSQHVGNHGGRYVDLHGHTKQFTYIDHDKKPKKSMYVSGDNSSELFAKFIQERIDEILEFPAVNLVRNADGLYQEFIGRSKEKGIVWKKDYVRETLSKNTDLSYIIFNRVWKNTIKEKYWFEEMSHEEIMAGKWKAWAEITE